MKSIVLSEFKAKCIAVLKEAQQTNEPVLVTRRGVPLAREAFALPAPFHKDPADRVLVATARTEHLVLVTADERILAYPHVRSRDARQ